MALITGDKIYRNLQEQVEENAKDIEELKKAGGAGYSAGTGIDIEERVISVDEDVAMKTDLDYDNLSNKPDLTVYAKLNDDTQTITAASVTTTPGAGYIHTTYGPSSISMSIPRTPGYTLNIPTKDGTLATTGDIPTVPTKTSDLQNDSGFITSMDIPDYTGGDGITINSGYVISAGSTLARVADIPSITGLTMRNYKIVINDQYQYNFSVPYVFDTDLSKYDAIRKIPVNSIIVDITNHKTGIFRWQTGTIAVIYWADNTSTPIDFTSGFNCVILANAPETM